MSKQEKTIQFVYYILSHVTKPSITVLMKLSYLADYLYYQRNSEQISNFKYVREKFGPFDKQLYNILDNLISKGLVTQNTELSTFSEFIVYEIKSDQGEIDLLSEKEISVVDEVISATQGLGAKTLTKLAYQTGPMKEIGATLGGDENMYTQLKLSTPTSDGPEN